MWGDETQAGPEEQSPRDQSKGRMRRETKYPLLEDCGKTKQREWSSVTFWSWPCVPGEASRLLLLCEEADTGGPSRHFALPHDSGRYRSKRTLLSHHDDGFMGTRPSVPILKFA